MFDPFAPGTGAGLCGWSGYVTNDWDRFVRMFWANRGAAVFIDEASQVFADHKRGKQAVQMMTAGRHVDWQQGGGGHSVTMISQRYTGIEKTARDQASAGFVFRVMGPTDAEALADHWGVEALRQAHALEPLHYYQVDSLGMCRGGRLTFPKG